MPYKILQEDGHYKVINSQTGKIHSKHTTKEKAEAQIRLLQSLDHIKKPNYNSVASK
jgi:hypothetical protein